MRRLLKRVLLRIFKGLVFFGGKSRTQEIPVKKILVVQSGGFGDVLRIFPAIEALHENFPEALISALVFPQAKTVFQLFPKRGAVAEIIEYEPEGLHKNFMKRLSLILFLRRKKIDLVYAPARGKGTDGTIIMMFLTGAKIRIGFSDENAGFLNTITAKLRADTSILKQNLSLLKKAGLKISRESVRLSEQACGPGILKFTRSVDKTLPLITMHPVAVWNGTFRSWPLAHYVLLSNMLVKQLGATIVILGSHAERTIGEKIVEATPKDCVINLAGSTTLPEMTCLIRKSDVFVGNDSGPLHIAEAVGTPFIGIFGPTSPAQVLSGTFQNCRTLTPRNMSCSPCYTHQGIFNPPCDNKRTCLDTISPEEVFEAVKDLLGTCRKRALIS